MIKYDKYKPSGVDWIGEVPDGWEVKKVKYCSDCYDGKRIPIDGNSRIEGPYPYWGAGNIVDYVNDYIFDEELVLLGEDGAQFFDRFKPVAFLVNEKIWVNNHIHVLKANGNMSPSYFRHALNCIDYAEYITGSVLTKLTQTTMNSLELPVPPLSEQTAIASYLDNKCSKIDNVIGLQQKRIALLKELKQSTITKAVTKGLDKNAKMKDSGVEWIGEVPEGWEVKSFKYCVRINNGADYKSIETDDEYAYPVIGSGGIFAHATKFMYDGEVVFLGRKGTVDKPLYYVGKFWAIDTMFYAVPQKNTNGKYLYYQALTFPFDYYLTNTARPSMTQTDLGDNKIAVPPIAEQTVIVAYLDERCATIDRQITKIERQIELLKEYKQSVITDCVTGKRKVCQ